MSIRGTLIILSLLAFLSTSIWGYLYYSSLAESSFDEVERQIVTRVGMIKKNLSSFLSENIRPVKTLAGMAELREGLISLNDESLAKANAILDHFNASLNADVCYLISHDGITIASSNRYAPDSFIGIDLRFRPYFKKAIKGDASTYLALGTTSWKRGAYYSHPVYDPNKEGNNPIGVAVIKISIELIEKELPSGDDELVLVTDPQGVIFISNRKEWLYQTIGQLTSKDISQIARTRQFGKGPWNWIGLEIKDKTHAVDRSGEEYLMHTLGVDNYPGWHVIHLQSLRGISKMALDPLMKIAGPVIFLSCIIIGISVFILYRKASHEIIQRKAAEEALRNSEERYRSIYHNAPAMLHSIDPKGNLVNVSDHWLEVLGYQRDEVIGKKLSHFFTEASRRYFETTVFPEFFQTGFCKDIPYQFVKKSGELIDVLLSAIGERDSQGNISRSLAVSIDVTDRKRAEKALELAKQELSRYSKDLERQVRKQTREITSILQNTPAVVFVKDKDCRYMMINPQHEALFGIKNEDIRGKTDYDIFGEDTADQFRASDLQVLSERRSMQVEESVPQDDGIHTYLSVKFPLFSENGDVESLCGIATDITAIKHAQDQLRRLSGRIMESQEKERSLIARELHDELGQMLTALRIDSEWIWDYLTEKDQYAADRALTLCQLIDKAINDVRGMSIRLRTGVLDDLGLIDALEWYTADFENRTGIASTFRHSNVPQTNDALATTAYRIVQEALTNVTRHAHASQVNVRLEMKNGTLELAVIDNGCGFDMNQLSKTDSLGIAGMRERAALVRGNLEIRSEQGKGTQVYFRVHISGSKETHQTRK